MKVFKTNLVKKVKKRKTKFLNKSGFLKRSFQNKPCQESERGKIKDGFFSGTIDPPTCCDLVGKKYCNDSAQMR